MVINRPKKSQPQALNGDNGFSADSMSLIMSRVVIMEVADQLEFATASDAYEEAGDAVVFEDAGPKTESITIHVQWANCNDQIRMKAVLETSFEKEKWWYLANLSSTFDATAPDPGENKIEAPFTSASTLSRHYRVKILFKSATNNTPAWGKVSIIAVIKTVGV